MLYFQVLGPLEIVARDRVLRPRGPLQAALLATLLASEQQLVPTDALIVELWGEQHPEKVENALHAHMSRLRRTLAALDSGRANPRLITHFGGYQLLVETEELDASVFMRGLDALRGVTGASPADTVRRLRALLGLWRGAPFGVARRGPIREAAAARYGESRVAAYDLLFEHELLDGNHERIISELDELLRQYPFQERFRQLLMVALYRAGRQVDALSVYRELWRRLSEELGLVPSPAMREYERAILDHDPTLNSNRVPSEP